MVIRYADYVVNKNIEMDETINSRYLLKVELNTNSDESIAVIMKNPSIANEVESDTTINKILDVAYCQNYKTVYVLNLFCYYSPKVKDIKDLIKSNNIIHIQENDKWIINTLSKVEKVLVGWGSIDINKEVNAIYNSRIKAVYELIKEKDLYVFEEDFSESSFPKHPQTLAINAANIILKSWKPKDL